MLQREWGRVIHRGSRVIRVSSRFQIIKESRRANNIVSYHRGAVKVNSKICWNERGITQ